MGKMFREDLTLDSQNAHRLDVIVHVCNPSIPIVMNPIDAHMPATLVYTMVNSKRSWVSEGRQ